MNKKGIFLLMIFGILFFSSAVVAQKQWTLEECINYAYENNLYIKQSNLNVESSDKDLLQSKLNLAPSLNASASQNFGWGRSPDPQTNIYATQQTQRTFFNMSSDVTLFNGLQQLNNMRKAEFDYLAKKYDSDKIRNDISLNIASAYLLILFNTELVNNSQRQFDISKEQISRTEKQVEAGSVARGSLLDMQAQGASEEAALIANKNKLMLSYLDLMQILDLEASNDFDIEKPNMEITAQPSLLPAEMIFNKSVAIMPEIKSAELRLQSADRTLAISKGARSPRIFAQGSFGTMYSDQILEKIGEQPSGVPIYGDTRSFNDQFIDNRDGSLVFGMSIPIFNGYQVSTNIKKSKIFYESVTLDLELEKNKLRKNIESAYADAIGAYQTFVARKKSVDALTESFKYTEEKFNVGMVNATDYNVSKIQLANAEADLSSAKFDYIFKTKILDFYLGRQLTFADIATEIE
jgi:outer membrane protein